MVAPLQIGGGITFGSGIIAGPDNKIALPPSLVLNFDGANYTAMPADGSTIAGTGAYPITVNNPLDIITWSSDNGGIFRNSSNAPVDFLTFGPDYTSTSQSYTVMMVYRSQTGIEGRLLNANSASPDWLLGLWGSGGAYQNIFFNGNFVGPNNTTADNNWQFIWATYNGTPGDPVSESYVANSSVPTTTFGTSNTSGGFDGLRLFGRYDTPTTSSEIPTADVGLVKLWDGVLTLSQIQAQWAAYKTRFGY